MKIPLVDENDNVINEVERGMERDGIDIYRVSALWLVNEKNELLVVRRAYSKAHNPGKLACSVAGTVEVGETYIENINKEAQEELGVSDVKFEELFKDFRDAEYRHFTMWYIARCDQRIEEFDIDEGEVAEIFWMPYAEVVLSIEESPEEWTGAGKSLGYVGKWIDSRN